MKFERKKWFFISLFIGLISLIPLQALYAYCGDGIKQEVEECDDGNFGEGDGCNAYCKLEDLTPPIVKSVSIPNEATNISIKTSSIEVEFSEPLNEESVNKTNVILQANGQSLEYELSLNENQTKILIHIQQNLLPTAVHAVKVRNVQDRSGNAIVGENTGGFYASTFKTETPADIKPPTVVVRPEGGTFYFAQEVSIKAYDGDYTKSDEFLDEGAVIYYTLNDYQINEKSNVYTEPLRISEGVTLRFFSVDKEGNKSEVQTHRYSFECPEIPNSEEVISKYPTCQLVSCKKGYRPKGNSCIIRLDAEDENDYKLNAATAPLLPSDKPITVSTRPALYITPEHKGIIARPLTFIDSSRGTTIEFEKDTQILNSKKEPFAGYIKPPQNLYMKDFPINFGYSFKSIFEFKSAEGEDLQFNPPFKIIIPFDDTYDSNEKVTVFTFDPAKDKYVEYSRGLYQTDLDKKQAVITSYRTGNFFIAQSGSHFNRTVFNDVQTHWAKNYIESLFRMGIVQGKSKGIFGPNDQLTRAEFVKIALKSAGIEPDIIQEGEEAPFKDVPLYSWFAPYVKKAKEIELIKGYDDGTFRPDQYINRVEAIKMLFSAFKFDLSYRSTFAQPDDTADKRFLDIKKIEWYFPYTEFAIKNRIMQGAPSLTNPHVRYFGPASPMTRAEMSKIAIKAIELSDQIKKKSK